LSAQKAKLHNYTIAKIDIDTVRIIFTQQLVDNSNYLT